VVRDKHIHSPRSEKKCGSNRPGISDQITQEGLIIKGKIEPRGVLLTVGRGGQAGVDIRILVNDRANRIDLLWGELVAPFFGMTERLAKLSLVIESAVLLIEVLE
jgi:hypothetical protein